MFKKYLVVSNKMPTLVGQWGQNPDYKKQKTKNK